MTRLQESESLDRKILVDEIRDRLADLNQLEGLQIVTKLASRQFWFPDSLEVLSKVNPGSLSLIAKAIVLFATPSGRSFDLSNSESNDLIWLLKAVNSLGWYSDRELNENRNETFVSFFMRTAYVSHSVSEPPHLTVGRAYAMFHERIEEATSHEADLNAAMFQMIGVTPADLWLFCSAIYIFYTFECAKKNGPWTICPDGFVVHASGRTELAGKLKNVLNKIAKSPQEIKSTYENIAKYRNEDLPKQYWVSEFNVLRDFPLIKINEEEYCCPFPMFAWARGAVGYYFDLLAYFAKIEEKENPDNPNPYDNVMGRILGDVFQDYVGLQIGGLVGAKSFLEPEFEYKVGKQKLDSPDWLLRRSPDLPLLVECKARRPTLKMQGRCSKSDWESEAKKVLSRAIGQLCVFLKNSVEGKTGSFSYRSGKKLVYAIVLYDPFPHHAFEDVREVIDHHASRASSDWGDFKSDVYFVPLSILELEQACLVEEVCGVHIEDQLKRYAT